MTYDYECVALYSTLHPRVITILSTREAASHLKVRSNMAQKQRDGENCVVMLLTMS